MITRYIEGGTFEAGEWRYIAMYESTYNALLARVAELEEAMRGLLVVKDIGDDQAIYCPWCKAHARSFKTPRIRHKTNCPRQKAAKLVQPEAALCVGS